MPNLNNVTAGGACVPPSRLTKRDLEMVRSSFGGKYAVTVHQTEEGLWTIAVKFEGKDEAHTIQTARGDTKVWRNFWSVISFVKENCKFATDVFIEIGDWKLARLNKALAPEVLLQK